MSDRHIAEAFGVFALEIERAASRATNHEKELTLTAVGKIARKVEARFNRKARGN